MIGCFVLLFLIFNFCLKGEGEGFLRGILLKLEGEFGGIWWGRGLGYIKIK